jgi:hypothetical protein
MSVVMAELATLFAVMAVIAAVFAAMPVMPAMSLGMTVLLMVTAVFVWIVASVSPKAVIAAALAGMARRGGIGHIITLSIDIVPS